MITEFSQTYRPFQYPELMEYAIKHEKIHWHEEEIDLNDDVQQWQDGTLTGQDKNYITQILRLFTQTDTQVGQNYCDLFIPYIKNNEARCMMLSFAAREGIHQRAYALFTDTIGMPDSIYSEFTEYEEMAEKIEFMQNNDPSTKEGLGKSLAQTVCNEGMSLFSSFVMLLSFQRFGKALGLCKIAEWSLRDETQHVEGMSKLFLIYLLENPEINTDEFRKSVYQMYRDAVALEDKFIDLVFEQGEPEGLTKEDMKQYIRYIANRRLMMIGFKPNWEEITENPFPWLDWVLNEGHTNFFEQRVSDYSVAGLEGDWEFDKL